MARKQGMKAMAKKKAVKKPGKKAVKKAVKKPGKKPLTSEEVAQAMVRAAGPLEVDHHLVFQKCMKKKKDGVKKTIEKLIAAVGGKGGKGGKG